MKTIKIPANVATALKLKTITSAKLSNNMLKAYLETAVDLTDDDEGDDIADLGLTYKDFVKTAINQAKKDLTTFIKKAGSMLDGVDDIEIGNGFWETRNSYGSGFESAGDDVRNKLSSIAEKFGNRYVFVTKDNKLDMQG